MGVSYLDEKRQVSDGNAICRVILELASSCHKTPWHISSSDRAVPKVHEHGRTCIMVNIHLRREMMPPRRPGRIHPTRSLQVLRMFLELS